MAERDLACPFCDINAVGGIIADGQCPCGAEIIPMEDKDKFSQKIDELSAFGSKNIRIRCIPSGKYNFIKWEKI